METYPMNLTVLKIIIGLPAMAMYCNIKPLLLFKYNS